MASKAIPSHLRSAGAANGSNGAPESGAHQRHHGKTQSHVVSESPLKELSQSQNPAQNVRNAFNALCETQNHATQVA